MNSTKSAFALLIACLASSVVFADDSQNATPNLSAPTSPQNLRHRPALDDQQACDMALREIAHHIRNQTVSVSGDGSSIVFQPAGSKAKTPGAAEKGIKIYSASGLMVVSGPNCPMIDSKKTIGDGIVDVLTLASNQRNIGPHHVQGPIDHREHPRPMIDDSAVGMDDMRSQADIHSGPTGPRGGSEHHDPMSEAIQHCAKVYPQVEAWRAAHQIAAPAAPTEATGQTPIPPPAAKAIN